VVLRFGREGKFGAEARNRGIHEAQSIEPKSA